MWLFRLIVVATTLGLSVNNQITLADRTAPADQIGLMASPGIVENTSAILAKPDQIAQLQVSQTYGKLPLSFEANQGQTDSQVKYFSRGKGYTLFLTTTEAVLALPQFPSVLHMKLIGANPAPQITGLEELPGKSNYLIGNNPQKLAH